jgi:hypothetical protein
MTNLTAGRAARMALVEGPRPGGLRGAVTAEVPVPGASDAVDLVGIGLSMLTGVLQAQLLVAVIGGRIVALNRVREAGQIARASGVAPC